MILHALKKQNDPELWACFKVGYSAEDATRIIDAADVYFRRRKIRNRSTVTDEEWRLLTLAYLKASVDAHKGGPWPQYGLSNRTIVTYPEAINLIESKQELGDEIVQRNRAHVIRLINDISRELGEGCEVDLGIETDGPN
jgi:hypothetical protein